MNRRPKGFAQAAYLVILQLITIPPALIGWEIGERRTLEQLRQSLADAREPTTGADLLGPAIPDEQNAAIALKQAGDAIPRRGEHWRWLQETRLDQPLDAKGRRHAAAIVGENAATFHLVDQAMSKPSIRWDRVAKEIEELSFAWQQGRSVCTVLRVAALHEHASGNDSTAIAHVRRMEFAARAMAADRGMVSDLVATGCMVMTADAARMIASDMKLSEAGDGATNEDVRRLIAELLDDKRMIASWRGGMQAERMRMYKAPAIRDLPTQAPLLGSIISVWHSRDAVLMVNGLTTLAAAADAPTYPEHVARSRNIPDPERNRPAFLPQRNIFQNMMWPSVRRWAFNHYRGMAERRSAAIALAARLYRVDHKGDLPKTVEDLVKNYLPTAPLDPFGSNGATMKIKIDGTVLVIYSVGQDGIDQNASTRPTPWRDPEDMVWSVRFQR